MTNRYDLVVIGAGGAGLMCAATAGQRGLKVLVLDHGKQAGRKILISGGGRCNFTNMYASADNYLSQNPHFCKSALKSYTPWDFIALVDKYRIPYHEKTLGQLFCDQASKDIVDLLLKECRQGQVDIQLRTEVKQVQRIDGTDSDPVYTLTLHQEQRRARGSQGTQSLLGGDITTIETHQLVVATGGLSMPKLGATAFGYKLAEQFGHTIEAVRAGLVPFTLHDQDKELLAELSGVALPVQISNDRIDFSEAMLFTHRGLSGPAILQISSYWLPGEPLWVNLLPEQSVLESLKQAREQRPKMQLDTLLEQWLPKRLVHVLFAQGKSEQSWSPQWATYKLADCSNTIFESLDAVLHAWEIKPNGTEGYRTAEVTLGGVCVDEVSSKTMESRLQKNLYFIGEVLDVTGWLGGYNFQWAWSSGVAAGKAVKSYK